MGWLLLSKVCPITISIFTWSGGCNPDISSGCSSPKFSPLSHEAQAAPLAVGRSAFARFAPAKKIKLIDAKGELEGRVMRGTVGDEK